MTWLNTLSGSEFIIVAAIVGCAGTILLFAILFAVFLAYWWATEGDDGGVPELRAEYPLVEDGHRRSHADRPGAAAGWHDHDPAFGARPRRARREASDDPSAALSQSLR
jgi:hypothetical protein